MNLIKHKQFRCTKQKQLLYAMQMFAKTIFTMGTLQLFYNFYRSFLGKYLKYYLLWIELRLKSSEITTHSPVVTTFKNSTAKLFKLPRVAIFENIHHPYRYEPRREHPGLHHCVQYKGTVAQNSCKVPNVKSVLANIL